MALMLQTAALGVCLVGAIRFFRQQHAMSVGKVYAGGWEVLVVGGGSLMVSFPRRVENGARDL